MKGIQPAPASQSRSRKLGSIYISAALQQERGRKIEPINQPSLRLASARLLRRARLIINH